MVGQPARRTGGIQPDAGRSHPAGGAGMGRQADHRCHRERYAPGHGASRRTPLRRAVPRVGVRTRADRFTDGPGAFSFRPHPPVATDEPRQQSDHSQGDQPGPAVLRRSHLLRYLAERAAPGGHQRAQHCQLHTTDGATGHHADVPGRLACAVQPVAGGHRLRVRHPRLSLTIPIRRACVSCCQPPRARSPLVELPGDAADGQRHRQGDQALRAG